MEIKIYKLLSRAKQGLFALVLILFSGAAYSQATYTFNFTGTVQTINLPAGSYSAECWGAIGGWHANDPNMLRGKGGYSSGTFTLLASTTLYIAVGGAGGTQINSTVPGGWNGGGPAKYYTYSYNGGGGATHIATTQIGGGQLSNYVSSQNAVLIVAGGGGGGATSQTPGNGGGSNGGNSSRSGCTGGTQTTPGASSIIGGNATFGQGWDGTPTGGSYGAGGGGWYGGGCESGGSGYIGGVGNGVTASFGQTGFITNPDVNGNGMVLIKELCSVTLTATGVNANGICAGNSVTLTTNAVSNYSWSTAASTSSIVVTPGSTTLYSLTATSPSNCTGSAALTITVNPIPVLSAATSPTLLCAASPATITATGASTYTWAGGAISNTLSVNPLVSSVYSYTGTSAAGCVATGTASVLVNSLTIAVPLSVSVCKGKQINVVASGGTSYLWSNGSPFNTLIVTPLSSTSYTLDATDPNNCQHTSVVNVTVNPNPTVTASADRTVICKGEPLKLTAGGATTYTWNNPPSTNGIVTLTPTSDITYFYDVAGIDINGCAGTATVSVKVEKCSGLSDAGSLAVSLEIFPNPNNGSFTIRSQNDLSLEISNELGQIIKRFDISAQTGNQVSIKDLPAGVYFVSTNNRSVNYKIVVSR